MTAAVNGVADEHFLMKQMRAASRLTICRYATVNSKHLGTVSNRPSKCPKFYTNRIFGEQNLRQNFCKFGQNFNCNKMTYLIKYTYTVQFSI